MRHPSRSSFDKLVQGRVGRERAFVEALLEEAVQAMLGGELDVSLMFGPKGNPTAANMVSVLDQLQQYTGVSLQVKSVRVPRRRAASGRPESAGRVA